MEKTSWLSGRASTDLSVYDNSWWNPGPKWKIILWFLVSSVTVNSYLPLPISFKKWILTLFGAKIGAGFAIKPKVNIKFPWFLTIGDYVWVGEEVWIDNLAPVTIGNHVCISQGAMFETGNHNYRRRTFDLFVKPIHLENGVWIGARSIVCPGVTCHSHSILTVGSVATQSLEAYGIYQGNPAIRVKNREVE
ncbi:WcaF family extracellular polysaccharide biosynthesis acetyltransferase [Larkinella terrae]|uniref:Colanic acid biosynthesis acetyltransferase WcaF n=1 Tax=Larkinella terrae TaxID=2025311 RepID=A0A7K0EUE6_9BACT|nr:WcaF family extracellular polysaccharide biosynthesis acetyltransferase [Larkinella terrae]MRS65379.1 colanic acid biosynthesis acetyltransferase WcaF [Larkinella terrae]